MLQVHDYASILLVNILRLYSGLKRLIATYCDLLATYPATYCGFFATYCGLFCGFLRLFAGAAYFKILIAERILSGSLPKRICFADFAEIAHIPGAL